MADTECVIIETNRAGYSKKDVVDRTLTVGELIEVLEDYDEDSPVILSFDHGYTYGPIREGYFDTDYLEDEEEDDDEDFDE